jgi:hypothetical protein
MPIATNSEIKTKIVRDYTNGESSNTLVSKYHKAKITILKILKEAGVTLRDRRVNLRGMSFGRLTVISESATRSLITYWNCKCSCGKNSTVSTNALIRGTTTSCGCYGLEQFKKRITKTGDFAEGKRPLYASLFMNAKSRAKVKKVPFSITYEDVKEKLQDTCPVFPWIKLKVNKKGKTGNNNSPTIDRFYPDEGYTKENISIICRLANTMKQRSSIIEIEHLHKWMAKENAKRKGLPPPNIVDLNSISLEDLEKECVKRKESM